MHGQKFVRRRSFKGESVDFDKCLFNHEQDCQIDVFDLDEDAEECEVCYE